MMLPANCGASPRRWLLPCLYLLLATGTAIAFAKIARHEFVRYDDDEMIFENARVADGLTRDGLRLALTGPHMGNWHPLTTVSHLIDCQFFGTERPGWHHLVSLGLHVASVLMLFEALRRMTGELWPSALVAALFAVHPLRVESVAWAAERKDVLSGFFWMLTLLAYAWYARRPGIVRYTCVALALCCGLLSKPTVLTLPFALLLLDLWPLRRWRRSEDTSLTPLDSPFPAQRLSRLVLEKIPLVAMAVVAGSIAIVVQNRDVVDHPSLAQLPLAWRLINAVVAYGMYLWKAIWPANLAVLYPHPGLATGADMKTWLLPALGTGAVLLAITVAALTSAGRRPYLVVGWLWYLGTLLPMIGLFQVGWQAYADRYTYLPMIGIYLMLVWGLRDMVCRWPRARYPVAALASVWLVALMIATWRQVDHWSNSRALFEHALRVTGDNPIMHNSYGNALDRQGKATDAIKHYRIAAELKPDYAMAHYNLGSMLSMRGDHAEAIRELRKAVEIDPRSLAPRNNLGTALLNSGETAAAIDQFREAVRLNPNFAGSQYNLGNALQSAGHYEEAIEHFRQAVRLMQEDLAAESARTGVPDPLSGDAATGHPNAAATRLAKSHYSLGSTLAKAGRTEEALEQFRAALRLNPRLVEVYNDLGNTLLASGRPEAALASYQTALQLEPQSPFPLNNLGNALQQLGRFNEAISYYRQALQLDPKYADAHNGVGVALLNLGRAEEAADEFRTALKCDPHSAARTNLRRAEEKLIEDKRQQP